MTNLTVTGNATISGDIVGNVYGAQANITSVGTLTSLTVTGTSTLQLASDILSVVAGATGVVVHNLANSGVFYHTTPAANFTANFTNAPVTNNRVLLATLIINQGATPYLPTAVQIEGAAQTIKWSGGSAPAGNANKIDIISFSLIRVSNSWSVIGSGSNYS